MYDARTVYRDVRRLLLGLVVGAVIGWLPAGVDAQDVEELFRKVNPSVVVIKAKGRDVSGQGPGDVQ